MRLRNLLAIGFALAMLVASVAGQAADLQAGWYAKIIAIDVYAYDSYGRPVVAGNGYFYGSPTGDYGPFHVGGPQTRVYEERDITVPRSVSNAGADQSFILPLSLTLSTGTRLAYISFVWQTYYEASQMYVDLCHTQADGRAEQLWVQPASGLQFDTTHAAFNTVLDGAYYFRVNVVPEPLGVMPVVVGILGLVCAWRKTR